MPIHTDDDWRLTVRFASDGEAHGIFSRLRPHAAAAFAAGRLKEGVVAERDGQWLRVYAASYDGLRRAQQIIAHAIELEGVHAHEAAQHHDASADRWEAVALPPIPEREKRLVAEHHGAAPWGAEAEPDRLEIRFEMTNRSACVAFAETLREAGYQVYRRGSFLFLFADDQMSAHKLGEQLRALAPRGAKLYYMGEGPSTIFF
jgi:hypothetical protein